jgi:hypothetical protein
MYAITSEKFAASAFRVDDKIARGMLGIKKIYDGMYPTVWPDIPECKGIALFW